MRGLMQDWPLLCHRILEHAATIHGTQEVVTRSVEGPIHRTNYAEIRNRALKISQRLDRDGIRLGDRVATIAWNTWRHLEAWYGIMGIGAICHTVNPRLFPDQIAWIINHAEDRVVMTDITFVPLLEKIADKLSGKTSTRIPRPRCATPREPPAIPRACCIRIAPTCCMP
jgi:fatty-acyl-CoA synthase